MFIRNGKIITEAELQKYSILDTEFENWMREVNDLFESVMGMDTSHFPDTNWCMSFDIGLTPLEACQAYSAEQDDSKWFDIEWGHE